MKKMVVYGLGATMLLSSATLVQAEDATEVKYGFAMTAPGTDMKEDITIVSKDDAATGSMEVTTKNGDEEITISLPNYVLAADNKVYLNVGSFRNMASAVPEFEGMDMIADMLGLTEEWLELVPIDLSAVNFEAKPFDVQIPELDEETLGKLAALQSSVFTVDFPEEGMVFTVNGDSIKATAEALDEIKNDKLGFVGDILTYGQDVLSGAAEVDIKPAIRNYLDAAAEGYVAANEGQVDEEQAKTMIDMMADMLLQQGLGAVAEQIKAIPVADLWNSFSFASLAEGMDGYEAKLVIGETTSFSITAAGTTITGTVETTEDGAVITLLNNDEAVATIDVKAAENGIDMILKDTEGNEQATLSAAMAEKEDGIDASCDFTIPSAEVEFHGYLTQGTCDDSCLAAPETSVSTLDLIKNAAGLFLPKAGAAE